MAVSEQKKSDDNRGKDNVIYRSGRYMTFSVRIIIQALIDLDAANVALRYRDIAAYAECSEHTVARAIKKLESQKKIRRVVAPGGYNYEIKAD